MTLVCRECECMVVNLNYRHAPEDPYPAAVEDVADGLSWIAGKGAVELGIDISKIGLGGLSA